MKNKDSQKKDAKRSAGLGIIIVAVAGLLAGYGIFTFVKKEPPRYSSRKTYTKVLRKPMPKPPESEGALQMKIVADEPGPEKPEKPARPAAEKEAKPAEKPAPAPKKVASLPKPEPKAEAAPGDLYVVQVGAFKSEENAGKLATDLRDDGFNSFTNPWTHERLGKMYRVRVGPVKTKAEAGELKEKLADKGFKPFIIKNP